MWYRDLDHLRQTEEYVSLYDFIQALTGSANPRTEWVRLQAYFPGICVRIPLVDMQFAGSGERVTPCTNAVGVQVLGRLLMAQKLDRAERSLARALKSLDKAEDEALLADLTAALAMARALRTPA
jgi:hypothetical protein